MGNFAHRQVAKALVINGLSPTATDGEQEIEHHGHRSQLKYHCLSKMERIIGKREIQKIVIIQKSGIFTTN